MKIFLKCNEAAHLCDKTQYKEAGWFERVSLKLHLVLCKCCRSYSSNNNKLSKAVKSSKIRTLPPEEKQRMRSLIKQNDNTP